MKTIRFIVPAMALIGMTFSFAIPQGMSQDYYEDPNKKILKEAVLGAGVGAVASGASGGDTGKGALIGAGTNVIGSAVLDTLTSSPSPQPQPQIQYAQQSPERAYERVEPSRRSGGCSRN